MPRTVDAPDPRPVDDSRWLPALRTLRADALDCLQTTFALIAELAHGAGAHLALGARWGLPAAEPSLETQLTQARDLLGLRPMRRWRGLSWPELRRVAAANGCLYVTADAYHLPWLPYAGRQHMEHSFLLDAESGPPVVVDAYHNDTPWGPARPGAWQVPPVRLDAAIAEATAITLSVGPAPPLDVAAILADNAGRLRSEQLTPYLARALSVPGDADDLERLVLGIWLACRERLLHAAWLAHLRQPPASASDMAELAEGWRRLAAHSYIALRRAHRGRSSYAGLVDGLTALLGRDVELAGRLTREAGQAVPVPPRVRAVVTEALSIVLGLDNRTIDAAAALRDLPGFDSFRLVEAIERAEEALGVEAAVERVGSAGLHDLDGLCQIFVPAEGSR
jgi:hypothetical protein